MTDDKPEKVTCSICGTVIDPFLFGVRNVWICKKCKRVVKSESVSVEGR